MENTLIKVGGMSCGGCVKSVTGVLKALDGVVEVEVSLEKAEAAVTFEPTLVSREALTNAIADAGFDAS